MHAELIFFHNLYNGKAELNALLIHKEKEFIFDGGLSFLPPSINSTVSYGISNKLSSS